MCDFRPSTPSPVSKPIIALDPISDSLSIPVSVRIGVPFGRLAGCVAKLGKIEVSDVPLPVVSAARWLGRLNDRATARLA